MKAALIERHGGPEVLRYADIADPALHPGHLIVDVYAASINAADWKVRRGQAGAKLEFPYVLGRDFSGVVSEIGAGVTGFEPGDAVFAVCQQGQEGAYAERIAIDASIVARKPDLLSHLDAAAIALAGLTALVSIEDTLRIQAHERILVQGGAGGVGSLAIQAAKHIGAHVITTASPKNHDYVRGIGADEVIDYHTQDFTECVADCDAVFDTVGGEVAERSFAVLKPGGRAAFVASGANPPSPPRPDVTSLRPQVGRDRAHLERLCELLHSGALQVPEMTVYPLSQAGDAHALSESRHLRGKLVFRVRE